MEDAGHDLIVVFYPRSMVCRVLYVAAAEVKDVSREVFVAYVFVAIPICC